MLWNTRAVVIGLVAGIAINMSLITLNAKVLYPAPKGLDMRDKQAFRHASTRCQLRRYSWS